MGAVGFGHYGCLLPSAAHPQPSEKLDIHTSLVVSYFRCGWLLTQFALNSCGFCWPTALIAEVRRTFLVCVVDGR